MCIRRRCCIGQLACKDTSLLCSYADPGALRDASVDQIKIGDMSCPPLFTFIHCTCFLGLSDPREVVSF